METNKGTTKDRKRHPWWHTMLLTVCLIILAPFLQAHEGPPFPIIVDEEAGPYKVSVWTDPDIGTGTFFVILEPISETADTLPEITSVQVGVEPVSGRLEEAVYTAEQQSVSYGARYYTEVEFDQGEFWNVRVVVKGPGWKGELLSKVEATPDGSIGPIGLLVYAIPFMAVGFLWIRAILIRRRNEDQ
jgi:hypothetical protein